MKRLTIIGLVLLTAACAHAPQDAPVRVIVNASDGAAGRVDTSVLQQVTQTEISHAGLARPLTLTVFFDSSGFVELPGGPANPTSRGVNVVGPQAVSDLSATPWEQGLIVQHGDRVEVGSRANQNYRREIVVGTYTISDEAGNVIEQRPVVVGATNPEISMMPLQIQSTRTTAHYLASRVAAVNR